LGFFECRLLVRLERQQSRMPRSFNKPRQRSLILGIETRDAPRKDLSFFCQIFPETIGFLVIHLWQHTTHPFARHARSGRSAFFFITISTGTPAARLFEFFVIVSFES